MDFQYKETKIVFVVNESALAMMLPRGWKVISFRTDYSIGGSDKVEWRSNKKKMAQYITQAFTFSL